jgi:hypothetical protein
MMALDVTTQLAPLLWGVVGILVVSGLSILAAKDRGGVGAHRTDHRIPCRTYRDESLPEAA